MVRRKWCARLIKHDVKVSFAKGEYDEADKLIKVLNKNFKNIPYDENEYSPLCTQSFC